MNFARYLSEKSIDLDMDFSELLPQKVEEVQEDEIIKKQSRRESRKIKRKEEETPKMGVCEKEAKRVLTEAVLQRMSDLLSASKKINNCTKLGTLLILNHGRSSCAIGEGVAIPHVRCLESRNLVMAFGICRHGVDFDAPDKQKVYIFIGMTAPNYNDTLYLRIYKGIANALLKTDVKERLLAAKQNGEIIRIFTDYFDCAEPKNCEDYEEEMEYEEQTEDVGKS